MIRRFMTVIAGTVAALMFTSTAALAGFCFNASRPANATQNAAASPAWLSLEELIALFAPELCEDGVDYLVSEVDPNGEFAMHGIVVLASGQQRNKHELSGNGVGIDHLSAYPEFEAAFEDAFPGAIEACID